MILLLLDQRVGLRRRGATIPELGENDHADQAEERAGHHQSDLGLARHLPRLLRSVRHGSLSSVKRPAPSPLAAYALGPGYPSLSVGRTLLSARGRAGRTRVSALPERGANNGGPLLRGG